MADALMEGTRALGPLLRQESTVKLLKSAGWTERKPLTVALRHELMGEVLDRAASRAMVLLIFEPERRRFTLYGFEVTAPNEDAVALLRQIPVDNFYRSARGEADPFKDVKVTAPQATLALN